MLQDLAEEVGSGKQDGEIDQRSDHVEQADVDSLAFLVFPKRNRKRLHLVDDRPEHAESIQRGNRPGDKEGDP